MEKSHWQFVKLNKVTNKWNNIKIPRCIPSPWCHKTWTFLLASDCPFHFRKRHSSRVKTLRLMQYWWKQDWTILLTSVNNVGSKTLFSPVKGPVEQRARRFLPCTDFHLCGFDQQQYSKTIEQFNMKGSRGIIDVRGGSNVHRGAGMRTPHSAVHHPLEKSSTTLHFLLFD